MKEIDDGLGEYSRQLGMVGLHLMSISETQKDIVERQNRWSPAFAGDHFDELMDEGLDTRLTSVDESVFEDFADVLVERMSSTVFRVRVDRVEQDLVEPLNEKLLAIDEAADFRSLRRHHEIAVYLDKILSATHSLNNSNTEQNRGIYLAFKDFTRNAVWNSLRLGMKVLIETGRIGLGVLFGFRKRVTDTDRIVNAINKLTQWQMNGYVTQQKSFFSRLVGQGVLGMPIRKFTNVLLDGVGIGIESAQQVEDRRSRGERVNPFQKFFTELFYDDVITKRGRLGTQDATFNNTPEDSTESLMKYQLRELRLISIAASSIQLNYLRQLGEDGRHYLEDLRDTETHNKLLLQFMADADKDNTKIVSNTKDIFKETRKHRLQAMWGNILKIGTSLVSSVVGIGGKLIASIGALTPLLKVIPGAIAALGAKILGSKIGGLGGDYGGVESNRGKSSSSKSSSMKKGVGLGAVTGIAGDFAADHFGRDTALGAGADIVGQTATYASTGALIGSVIPGLGTAIGAGIGGVLGAGMGLWDNWDTLKKEFMSSGESSPLTTLDEGNQRPLPDQYRFDSNSMKEVVEELKKSQLDAASSQKLIDKYDEMIDVLRGIFSNTKEASPSGFASPLSSVTSNMLNEFGGR